MGRKLGERLKVARMCKKFDGTGVVKIQCSEGAYAALKLSEMPYPSDWGKVVNGKRIVPANSWKMGVDSKRYRVLWPDLTQGARPKHRSSSFALNTRHTIETLYVLADFLRRQGVDFIGLANEHGSGFRPVELGPSSLAYMKGSPLHYLLTQKNFLVK